MEEMIKYFAEIARKVKDVNLREEYAETMAKWRPKPKVINRMAGKKETVLFFH